LIEGYGWIAKKRAGREASVISEEDGERLIADILGVDVRSDM
jgi:hypothetical protein